MMCAQAAMHAGQKQSVWYKKIGFILDRGYFSLGNIEYVGQCGYSFVVMVKGMASLVNQLVLQKKGTLEN